MAELVALMDLGSNAARFLLASLHPGAGFRILEEQRVQTQLGSSPSGLLPSAAVEETTEALRRFLRRVSNGYRPRVLAIATSAVREAPNRERLILALRHRDGIDVRVTGGPPGRDRRHRPDARPHASPRMRHPAQIPSRAAAATVGPDGHPRPADGTMAGAPAGAGEGRGSVTATSGPPSTGRAWSSPR